MIIEPGDVDTGLGFGDGAVVDLHLCRFAEDENSLHSFAARGNQNPLGG